MRIRDWSSDVCSSDLLKRISKELFTDSDLILAQEFMPTEFDWRVGVLDGKPLFVSQYTMAPKHWQIYNHGASGRAKHGGFRTLAIAAPPKQILDEAGAATRLLGQGLYGVAPTGKRSGRE